MQRTKSTKQDADSPARCVGTEAANNPLGTGFSAWHLSPWLPCFQNFCGPFSRPALHIPPTHPPCLLTLRAAPARPERKQVRSLLCSPPRVSCQEGPPGRMFIPAMMAPKGLFPAVSAERLGYELCSGGHVLPSGLSRPVLLDQL